MKNLFIAVFLFISSNQAFGYESNFLIIPHSSSALTQDGDKTYFEKLGDLFQQGVSPNVSRIRDKAWSGRCFSYKFPNEPTNAGYIFREKVATLDSDQPKVYEVFSYWKPYEQPDYFDNLNIDQVFDLKLEMKPVLAIIRDDLIEVRLSSKFISRLKVSGSYLIEELQTFVDDVGPIGDSFISHRCYYFIPEIN